ncbi:MAG: DUF4912 domain-containing protein [Cyanobacteriota bacterium]|jgi:hypothetical protein
MGAPGFAKDALSQLRLSQLRELARRLGVGRYSGMLRDQLIASIQVRAARVDANASVPASPEPPSQSSEALAVSVGQFDGLPRSVDGSAPSLLQEEAISLPAAVASKPTSLSTELVSSVVHPVEAVANQPAPSLSDVSQAAAPTWVSLLSRDPQWASVCWSISPADRERALSAGGQQLALRLTDVTDPSDLSGRPHILQEVIVDSGANEWHLPVPLGGRDYRVELGYRIPTGGWYSLAHSTVARIEAEAEIAIAAFAPFSLMEEERAANQPSPLPASGLHERLYQQASAARLRISQGSEAFHEQHDRLTSAAGGHLSGVGGAWASGREASGAGMPSRQRSFWLIADAELVVYGATDPAATLTVGDQVTPLSKDGTFRLHTAFPDGDQNYPIRALAADGEQQRSITIDFRRSTPNARVNTKESAVPEWF